MISSRCSLIARIGLWCGALASAYLAPSIAPSFAPSIGGASRVSAEEPAREFLQSLREAHYFDTAIDYLDQMQSSPLAPAKLREVIGYERGVTLVDGAKHQRDFGLREKQLDEAQKALEEFVAQQPNHQLTFAANSQLGNLVVERARLKMERTKRPTEPNKDKLKGEAKELYAKAYAVFNGLETALKTKLEGYPTALDPKKDAKRIEERDQARADYLQSQLLAAAVLEESTDTMDKTSKDYKETLEKAAKEYGSIYDKYRTRLAGLYARMYQGRAFQKLGNYKEALSFYEELLQQPDEPKEFHELKTKVLLLAIDCWMADSQKKYAEIVNRGNVWIDKAYPSEMRSDEFQGLRLAVAKGAKLYSDQLKKEKPKDPQIGSLLTDARKLAQYVARFQGEHQKDAQKFLADLGVGTAAGAEQALPKTFAEARQAGKDALDAYQVHKVNLDTLPNQIKAEKDANAKKELETKLAESQEGLKTSLGESLRLFQLALRLTDSETPIDDINVVRYYLCILNFFQGEYLDAAVLGSFVAERYPDSGGARPCAKIAMASYIQLFTATKNAAKQPIDKLVVDFDKDADRRLSLEELKATPPETQAMLAGADVDNSGKIDQNELLRVFTRFEADQIVAIANYITTKWPSEPEAQEALGTLIAFMISENQLDKAQANLDKIPEDSSQRGSAELKMGQALWTAYLQGMAAVRDQEQAAQQSGGTLDAAAAAALATRKTELTTLKQRAEKTLVDGVARMEKAGRIDATFSSAVLSLSQIFVDTEQATKAVELLEKANVGALALVTAKHEAAQKPGYVEETYRTALRAYISALAGAPADQGDALIKKAEGVMDGLKQSVGADEAGQKRLISIYFTLAKDIEQQMKLASPDAKKNLSKGFETFLDRVGAEATDMNVLLWVASTFYGLGESYGTEKNGAVPADATRYFTKAGKAYQDILDRAAKKQFEVDAQVRGQLLVQLAKTKRAMGDFDAAIKLFMQMLGENNKLLSVQIEACRTYEEWAERGGDPKYYLNALGGSMESKTKKSTIWGWIELARISSNRPEFRDAFYEARYHVSLARYKYGLAQKDAAKREDNLNKAEASLAQTYQLFPALDGDPATNKKSFRETYDGLAKTIQRALKKQPAGLAAYEKAELKVPGATVGGPAGKPGTGAQAKSPSPAKPAPGAKPAPNTTKSGTAPPKPTTTPKSATSATSK